MQYAIHRFGFTKITLHKLDTLDRIHLQHIHRNYAAFLPHDTGRILTPCARRSAQVEYRAARFDQAMPLLNLDELIYRARSPALLLGAAHVRIAILPSEPTIA